MADVIFDESITLRNCALDLLVGNQLGRGATRRVYALKHNPDFVIKIEFGAKQFCNVSEYELWNEVKGTRLARYFAPVIDIDCWAGALIMKRTEPITREEFDKAVKRLPDFFDDIHYGNFGRLDGKIVCHDYGYNLVYEKARKECRMKDAKHQ